MTDLEIYSAYLPYKVKCITNYKPDIGVMTRICVGDELVLLSSKTWDEEFYYDEFKLILRPLSDLKKEEYNEKVLVYPSGIDLDLKFFDSGNSNENDFSLIANYEMMGEIFTDELISRGSISKTPYHIVKRLLENHFDVFGLIEKGMAVNVNTI